jgi:hypothetical protein
MPTDYYDIEIGSYSNMKSLIRARPSMDNQAVTEGSPCKPDEWVTVTVAVVGGNTIVVSMGDTHGENVLMQWEDPEPISVNYIAVMTGWGTGGEWEFEPVENPRTIPVEPEVPAEPTTPENVYLRWDNSDGSVFKA